MLKVLRLLIVACIVSACCVPVWAKEKPADVTNSIGIRLIHFSPGEYVRGAIHSDQLRKNHPFSTGGLVRMMPAPPIA